VSEWEFVTSRPDETGESPFWHPHEQLLYWVDIPGRQIHRMDPLDRRVESWAMPSEPGCIAPAASGGLVVALRNGIYRARSWGGALQRMAGVDYDTATTRYNDGKADPAGRFWAGTMYEPRDAASAALYCIDLRGATTAGARVAVERKAGNATVANGLAWSPDARTLYWADTKSHVVRAWDWDARTSAMSKVRVFHQFAFKPEGWKPGQPGYDGRPDGATVDSQGHYWCAMFEGRRLVQLAASGTEVAQIAVPVQCPTMPCFGGPDLKTLYVTSNRQGRPAEELREQPLAGCVMAMRVQVAGLPVDFVAD
jgi:sugar lactone lactonase YvrE